MDSEETAQRVRAYLNDKKRQLGVALLLGETEQITKEADFLSKNLFGKAVVYVIPYNHIIRSHFKEWKLEFNDCVFIPTFKVWGSKLKEHLRYKATSTKEAPERHNVILRTWLGVHTIFETGSVSSLENIELLIRRQKLLSLEDSLKDKVPADEFEKLKADLQEMSGLFNLSEEENRKLQNENKALAGKVDILQDKNLTLEIEKEDQEKDYRRQLHNVRAAHAAETRKTPQDDGQLPREYPSSFKALQLFAPFYKHLVFAPKAWLPALDYEQFKEFRVAWEMLHDMDQVLWQLIFEEGGDIEKKFEERTPYGYAKGEGTQTTKDSKLAAKRRFEFDGKSWEMWAHIKYHTVPGRQLRIHFAVDNDKRRLIIGYIGEHMDNATTRTRH